MAFRDDAEAARARAEALERENRDLQQKIALLQSTKEVPHALARRLSLSSNWILGAGIAFIVVGGILLESRSSLVGIGIGIGTLGLLLVGLGTALRFIEIVGPNELLVLIGRERRLPDGSRVAYRVIRGGRVVRIPVLEQAIRLSLAPIEVQVKVMQAYTRKGMPVDVSAYATVKISSDPQLLNNALERFLARSPEDIARVARDTLEGIMRSFIVEFSPKEMRQDRTSLEQRTIQDIEEDFDKLGLALDAFHIETIHAMDGN